MDNTVKTPIVSAQSGLRPCVGAIPGVLTALYNCRRIPSPLSKIPRFVRGSELKSSSYVNDPIMTDFKQRGA
jgi:hypothetical protein